MLIDALPDVQEAYPISMLEVCRTETHKTNSQRPQLPTRSNTEMTNNLAGFKFDAQDATATQGTLHMQC